ncbi:hypothetical protein DFR42_1076 [Undibacterium pigrum]|uniref:Uncharacterized protein n=1 Tax=Undibacterium pigrum TaxID=401470 RepID=A0A318J178_9BURK|nr:hypothetical protein DFR42_1076 [Undibacterium pigrum]
MQNMRPITRAEINSGMIINQGFAAKAGPAKSSENPDANHLLHLR